MSKTTSGTYDSQEIQTEVLIREAFENLGIAGDALVAQQLDMGRRSITFLMQNWATKGVNLWTRSVGYIGLVENKGQYLMPKQVKDVRQINVRTYNRQLGGFPFSFESDGVTPDGIAANAFDGNPATACVQSGLNGAIIYSYEVFVDRDGVSKVKDADDSSRTRLINFVGIQTDDTSEYAPMVIQYSDSEPGDPFNWVTLLTIERQFFEKGVVKWFDIVAPVNVANYRLATLDVPNPVPGSRNTLEIQELYLCDNTLDTQMSLISRDEYYDYTNKSYASRPTVFYFDREIQPNLFIWPTPSPFYNCLQYTYQRMMEDVGPYTGILDVPARFYPALVMGLSARLALKIDPQRYQLLKTAYEEEFEAATVDDTESVPFTFIPDYSGGNQR